MMCNSIQVCFSCLAMSCSAVSESRQDQCNHIWSCIAPPIASLCIQCIRAVAVKICQDLSRLVNLRQNRAKRRRALFAAKCRVDETPKGWFISLIQADPLEEIGKDRKAKRDRAERDEEQRRYKTWL